MAYASEMDRIQDIVLDIENLREDYEKCIKSLGANGVNNIVSNREENNKLEQIIKKKDKELVEYKKDIDITAHPKYHDSPDKFQKDWDQFKLWDLKMVNEEEIFRAYSMSLYL